MPIVQRHPLYGTSEVQGGGASGSSQTVPERIPYGRPQNLGFFTDIRRITDLSGFRFDRLGAVDISGREGSAVKQIGGRSWQIRKAANRKMKGPMRAQEKRVTGFTLIELLVVIAII